MSSTSGPSLEADVAPPESITRFLRYAGYFVLATGRVRAEGLLPPPVDAARGRLRLETSVYRADGATSEELWRICFLHVDDPNAPMKARGTVDAGQFFNQGLSFDANGDPHPRHADVIGWPAEKHARKDVAREIADKMRLEVRAP